MMRTIKWLLILAALLPGLAVADEALWSLLRGGGQIVLIRHALTTPGVGDPEGMKLDDCKTQRNLSDQGRADAQRIGEAFRKNKVPVGTLQTSPWCRCKETALLAFQREALVEPSLGNLFGRRELEAKQIAELKKVVARAPQGGNAVMVTHGSTVLALTGVSPGTGELVILTPQAGGELKVAGRLQP